MHQSWYASMGCVIAPCNDIVRQTSHLIHRAKVILFPMLRQIHTSNLLIRQSQI